MVEKFQKLLKLISSMLIYRVKEKFNWKLQILTTAKKIEKKLM